MKITIGVMGSAEGVYSDEAYRKLVRLGNAIAERDCILMPGRLLSNRALQTS